MKTIRLKKPAWIVFGIVVCVVFTACNKKTSTPSEAISTQIEIAPDGRLSWSLKTLVEPYEKSGNTDEKWDRPAKQALTEFARVRSKVTATNEHWFEIISTNAAAAVAAGCNDPMVNYLFIKYSMASTNSKEAFTAAFRKAANAMEKSSYPPIRKFYAAFRTVEQFGWASGWTNNNWPPEIEEFDHKACDHLTDMLNDPATPAAEIYDACHDFLNIWGTSTNGYPDYWSRIEPLVFKNWSNDSSAWLLKGEANITMAWLARGNGWANTVNEDGWKSFSEHLTTADESLNHAWKLNSHDLRIAEKMLHVELGQGQGRNHMELWFNRAMEIDPNYYDACGDKLNYLEPKWHGSVADMLRFGRECVRSKVWKGQVPLVLAVAHSEIYSQFIDKSEQSGYWKRAEVWNDVKSSYDRFFDLNPEAFAWHHDYALRAYQGEKWDEFLHQVSLFTSGTNYDYFGGKAEFDKMVQLANEHVSGNVPLNK